MRASQKWALVFDNLASLQDNEHVKQIKVTGIALGVKDAKQIKVIVLRQPVPITCDMNWKNKCHDLPNYQSLHKKSIIKIKCMSTLRARK